MKIYPFVWAAIVAATAPTAALADDPRDPAMQSAAARARDREIIRQLNRDELAKVRERDARYAEGWRAWRQARGDTGGDTAYAARSRDYQRDMADYSRERDRYEANMAAWRRSVRACRGGDYSACDY